MTILLLGGAIRFVAAQRLSLHVDEPASILAARMVAERGLPLLPSGVLYLQGAPLSYALSPLIWMGFDDPDGLFVLRLPAVAAGLIAIYAAYRIAMLLTPFRAVGWLVASLVAVDPLSVRWSGHVRMYAPLQAFTLLFLWSVVSSIRHPTSRRPVRFVGPLAWAAVLTHPAAALVILPALVAIVAARGRRLLGPERRLGRSTVLAATAPIGLLVINRIAGVVSQPVSASSSFVGGHYLDLDRLLGWTGPSWKLLFPPEQGGMFARLMPAVIVLTSLYVLVWSIISYRRSGRRRAIVLAALLVAYWFPLLVVSNVAATSQARYVMNVQVLPYVLLAVPAADVLRGSLSGGTQQLRDTWAGMGIVPILVSLVVVGNSVAGLSWMRAHPQDGADYQTALAYVAANRQDREVLLASLPPVADFALPSTDNLMFLAGPEGGTRARWYVVTADQGRPVDYWLGVPAIRSTEGLCELLDAHPDLWMVIDEQRLGGEWAYQGEMGRVILGLTYGEFRAPGGALVRRVAPPDEQIPSARALC